MRNLIFIVILSVHLSTNLFGQIYKPAYKTSDNPNIEILHIGMTDSMTHVFFKYQDKLKKNNQLYINEESFIRDNSGNKYKLLNSVNIPYGPAYHEFDKENDVLYFILTFRAIPKQLSEIDLISEAFNIYGISLVNNSEITENINFLELLETTPVKEKGFYYKEGKVVQYYVYKGKVVAMHFEKSSTYGRYFTSFISIENYDNKRFDFLPEKLKIVFENNVSVESAITHEEFIKKVTKKQSLNTFFVALGEYSDASSAGNSVSNSTTRSSSQNNYRGFSRGVFGSASGYVSTSVRTYSNSFANTTTINYDATANYFARQNARSNVSNYREQQNEILESINLGYLKRNTIFPNNRLNGFINFKYKESVFVDIIVPIGEDKFIFRWPHDYLPPGEQPKIVVEKSEEEKKIEEILTTPNHKAESYRNIDSVTIGDVVKFKTSFGDEVVGVITKLNSASKVEFVTFPSIGQPFYWEAKYTELLRLKVE